MSGPVTIVKGDQRSVEVTNTISRDKGSLKMKKDSTRTAPGSRATSRSTTIVWRQLSATSGSPAVASTTIGRMTGTAARSPSPTPSAPTGWTFGTVSSRAAGHDRQGRPTKRGGTNTISRDTGSLKVKKNFDGERTPASRATTRSAGIAPTARSTRRSEGRGGAARPERASRPGRSARSPRPSTPTAPDGWTFGTPVLNPVAVRSRSPPRPGLTVRSELDHRDTGSLKVRRR